MLLYLLHLFKYDYLPLFICSGFWFVCMVELRWSLLVLVFYYESNMSSVDKIQAEEDFDPSRRYPLIVCTSLK